MVFVALQDLLFLALATTNQASQNTAFEVRLRNKESEGAESDKGRKISGGDGDAREPEAILE